MMVLIIALLCCRETKIEVAFDLWNKTAQDDFHLAGRKERLDDLINQKKVLLMLLAGRQSVFNSFHGRILFWSNHATGLRHNLTLFEAQTYTL